ncbi:DUF305 domain-containing protein [Aquipuribacter sp. MA13-6]|uniref:DUF305 domain-containing protein n=1 Tax=unclassified Aquipuribacter TaxID=2635084 RepID=UPI003EEF4889
MVTATLAVACLGLAACSDGDDAVAAPSTQRAPNVVQPGAPGEDSVKLDATVMPSVAPAPHTEVDVAFMQDMIGHHAQAIVMTSMVQERSENESLQLFVERMDITQVGEIEQMQDWLEDKGEEVPAWDPVFGAQGGHSDGMMMMDGDLMPGMATEDEMAALEAATGEEFDRLFIELMTRHHEGAITMVQELFAEGGGEEMMVFQLAGHIESDQNIEIDRMRTMLAEMDA